MASQNQTRLVGRDSYVLQEKTKGGMITVRLPHELHKRFAQHCKDAHVSMNKLALKLIEEHLDKCDPSPTNETSSDDTKQDTLETQVPPGEASNNS